MSYIRIVPHKKTACCGGTGEPEHIVITELRVVLTAINTRKRNRTELRFCEKAVPVFARLRNNWDDYKCSDRESSSERR